MQDENSGERIHPEVTATLVPVTFHDSLVLNFAAKLEANPSTKAELPEVLGPSPLLLFIFARPCPKHYHYCDGLFWINNC